MNNPSLEYSNRAKMRSVVENTINHVTSDLLAGFNEDLSAEIGAEYGGLVLFTPEKSYANATIAIKNNLDSTPEDLHDFLDNNIKGRRIDVTLGTTALGSYIQSKQKEPEFAHSHLNPNHMTWIAPSSFNDNLIGLAQIAIDLRYAKALPSEDVMNRLWEAHSDNVQSASLEISKLKVNSELLGDTLELDLPTTPNAFVVRWDAVNSTEHATSKNRVAFKKYLKDIERLLDYATKDLEKSTIDTGDGQNMVIFLPPNVERNNESSISVFGKAKINPLIEEIIRGHGQIASNYPEFDAQIRLAVDLSHVEEYEQGGEVKHTGPAFWQTSRLLKNSSEPVKLTEAAHRALVMDGADRAKK